jgi:pyrroloquinoline quinone biosynthesis protein E
MDGLALAPHQEAETSFPPPMGLMIEITHRCPLQCPYCSNPLALETASSELDTANWLRVLDEAADIGVLQVHFSGGEPLARRDLPELIGHASRRGLYTNIITSGVQLDDRMIGRLTELSGCRPCRERLDRRL